MHFVTATHKIAAAAAPVPAEATETAALHALATVLAEFPETETLIVKTLATTALVAGMKA